jgi:hypothetical protein
MLAEAISTTINLWTISFDLSGSLIDLRITGDCFCIRENLATSLDCNLGAFENLTV